MSGNYDVQQVCENGHQITGCYNFCPDERKKFCQECGAATIIACPTCNEKIQGVRIEVSQSWVDAGRGGSKMFPGRPVDVPSYCSKCGNPYPWTENKIVAAVQIFAEFGDIDEEEKRTIEQDIKNIAKDIPQTKPSAMRIKRILEKCGKVAYDVIIELASKTAAEILKK